LLNTTFFCVCRVNEKMARSSIVLSMLGVLVMILQGHAMCPNDPTGNTDICDDDNETKVPGCGADLMFDLCVSTDICGSTGSCGSKFAPRCGSTDICADDIETPGISAYDLMFDLCATTTTITTTPKPTSTKIATKPETKNATKVMGKLNFKLTLPENETAASFVKNATVIKGVAKGIATKLKVDASWVTVVLTVATAGRRLAGTTADISVAFTITVPASSTNPAATAASLVSSLEEVAIAGTSAWSSTLKAAVNMETAKSYDVVVTSVAHTPPATSTAELPAGSASGAERASLMMAGVAAATLLCLA